SIKAWTRRIRSQYILCDAGIMLYSPLTIRRRIEARGGFPATFRAARSAALRRSPQFYEVCARSDAAHRRAEPTHACPALAPHGIGSAVVALIFSMANREVTFLSGTAAIRRL